VLISCIPVITGTCYILRCSKALSERSEPSARLRFFSQPVQNSRRYLLFLPRDARISAAYAVLRCLSVTFVYRVETVKDAAIVAMECE